MMDYYYEEESYVGGWPATARFVWAAAGRTLGLVYLGLAPEPYLGLSWN